mmetsp:Transcript_39572/g.104957  ORF Transcript_39572/g.104957 Transcript_39572/m.104957 type:complete len:454 (-) Transcript_39572:286-1647(-)
MYHFVRTMTGKNIGTRPQDSDAEAAVPPDQQLFFRAGRHAKGDLVVSLQSGLRMRRHLCCSFSGGRVASVAAVVVTLVVTIVFSVVAVRKRSVSRTEPVRSNILSLTEGSSLGAAVCVVGQATRLEIESKIQNIIDPLANVTHVDVFLSLEIDDHAVFNNPITVDVDGAKCRGSELDVDGLKEAFAPYFRDGVFGPHVDENVTLERWPKLYKRQHPDDDAKRKTHIANVASQLRHQKDCAELIQKSEESAGGKYDIVVKVRDNTIALRPVAPDKLLSITEVVLKDCSKWGGVNDKVMALPRKHLEKSLGATYPSMIAVMNDDPLDHKLRSMSDQSANTEQVVMHTLVGNAVPFRELTFEKGDRDGDNYLPFVDGRCYAGKEPGSENRWCIVSHCKDCWPSMPWTYNVSCEVARTGLEVGSYQPNLSSQFDTSFDEQTLADPDPTRECANPLYR